MAGKMEMEMVVAIAISVEMAMKMTIAMERAESILIAVALVLALNRNWHGGWNTNWRKHLVLHKPKASNVCTMAYIWACAMRFKHNIL